MAQLKGECLCGKIKYEYNGAIGNLVHCHCSRCRKWHGSPFRSRVVIKKENYKWTEGKEYLKEYQSTPNVTKTFCRICGSNLATIYPSKPEVLGLPLAGTEGDLGDYKAFHIFVGSKAKWWNISDDLPQYDELPEDRTLIHCINE